MSEDKSARVLVVEDNPDNRRLLSIYLEREGYEVLEACDGVEGWSTALTEPLDLIISDIHMPRMDGYALCQRLKGDPRTEQIPVILTTAVHTSPQDTLEGLDRGANDFLRRPFRQSELLARVRTQLRIKELQDSLVRAERVATIGRMVATMAHEVNNPLLAILGHVEVTLRELEQDKIAESELRRSLNRIRDAAMRIRDVVSRLREVSHPDIYEYAPGLEGISLQGDEGPPS